MIKVTRAELETFIEWVEEKDQGYHHLGPRVCIILLELINKAKCDFIEYSPEFGVTLVREEDELDESNLHSGAIPRFQLLVAGTKCTQGRELGVRGMEVGCCCFVSSYKHAIFSRGYPGSALVRWRSGDDGTL